MEQFTFAGFAFPRRIPRLVTRNISKGRLAVDTTYYHAPILHSDGVSFYFNSDFAPGLRVAYSNETHNETPFGIVYRLPHKRGFIAGWSLGNGISSFVETSIWSELDDAISHANDLAERMWQDMQQEEFEQNQHDDELGLDD